MSIKKYQPVNNLLTPLLSHFKKQKSIILFWHFINKLLTTCWQNKPLSINDKFILYKLIYRMLITLPWGLLITHPFFTQISPFFNTKKKIKRKKKWVRSKEKEERHPAAQLIGMWLCHRGSVRVKWGHLFSSHFFLIHSGYAAPTSPWAPVRASDRIRSVQDSVLP